MDGSAERSCHALAYDPQDPDGGPFDSDHKGTTGWVSALMFASEFVSRMIF
jgi:hypothetical protein